MEEQKAEEKEKEKARTEPRLLLDLRSQTGLAARGRQGRTLLGLLRGLSEPGHSRQDAGSARSRDARKTSRSWAGAGLAEEGGAGGRRDSGGRGRRGEGRGQRRGRGGSDGAGQREQRPRHVAAGAAVPAAEQRRG